MKLAAVVVPFLFALGTPAFGGVRYVDAALASGANDGTSWVNAYQGPLGLQLALAAAQPGDDIWVREGRYVPALVGHRELSFDLKADVGVYGGFLGSETEREQRDPAANLTVLSGDLANNDASGRFADNSFHVVTSWYATGNGILDGFTIRDGRANGTTSWNADGAGVFCMASFLTLTNCVVRDNAASGPGGGAFLDGASARIKGVRFVHNESRWTGGAVLMGGCADVQFEACEFRDNSAGACGGLANSTCWHTLLRNCVITNNHATATATYHGAGGIEATDTSMDLVNCTIAGNTSVNATTGGVRVLPPSLQLANCIVYSNQGTGGGGQTIDNINLGTAEHCCIEGGYGGVGNISANPLFVGLGTGDVQLAQTSPCADAGDNAALPTDLITDFTGAHRFEDDPLAPDTGAGGWPVVDIGAYELPNTLYALFCAADGSLPTACPCGNTGSIGRGCASSDLFSPGALLLASGASTSDSVTLTGSDLYPSGNCVFLQADQQNTSGLVFGDGVRCVAGSLKRLYVKTASGGAASAPGAGDPSISARSAALGDTIAPGTQRFYQVYYRDPDLNFCPAPTGNTWNVSSGVIVNW